MKCFYCYYGWDDYPPNHGIYRPAVKTNATTQTTECSCSQLNVLTKQSELSKGPHKILDSKALVKSKDGEHPLQQSISKGFVKARQFLHYSPVVNAEWLGLPIYKESAFIRMAGQIQPGDIPSAVPVRKRPVRGRPKKSRLIAIVPNPALIRPVSPPLAPQLQASTERTPSRCAIPIKLDQHGTGFVVLQKVSTLMRDHSYTMLPSEGVVPLSQSSEDKSQVMDVQPPQGEAVRAEMDTAPTDDPQIQQTSPFTYTHTSLSQLGQVHQSMSQEGQLQSPAGYYLVQAQHPSPVMGAAYQPQYMILSPSSQMVLAHIPTQDLVVGQMLTSVPAEQQAVAFPLTTSSETVVAQAVSPQPVAPQAMSPLMMVPQMMVPQIIVLAHGMESCSNMCVSSSSQECTPGNSDTNVNGA